MRFLVILLGVLPAAVLSVPYTDYNALIAKNTKNHQQQIIEPPFTKKTISLLGPDTKTWAPKYRNQQQEIIEPPFTKKTFSLLGPDTKTWAPKFRPQNAQWVQRNSTGSTSNWMKETQTQVSTNLPIYSSAKTVVQPQRSPPIDPDMSQYPSPSQIGGQYPGGTNLPYPYNMQLSQENDSQGYQQTIQENWTVPQMDIQRRI